MDKTKEQFEQQISQLAEQRVGNPGYVELNTFYEDMKQKGLVVKQDYPIKTADPVETVRVGNRNESSSWFGNYLSQNQPS